MNELNKLCDESIHLEHLLVQLGEKPDFLAIKKFENIRDFLPEDKHCDVEWIAAFYYGYISELYSMYCDRMNNTKFYFYREDLNQGSKYYNKRDKKQWTE